MLHISNHWVGFYNVSQTSHAGQTASKHVAEIDPVERGPVSYIVGYVVYKLFKTNKRKTGRQNEELHALLLNIK